MNEVEKVTVVPYQGRFAIQDEDGGFYYTNQDKIRVFAVASDATYYLKGVCEKCPSLGYVVTLPSGKKRYLGTALPPEEEGKYGPHIWEKNNLVTISDSTGLYDIYICIHCGIKEKTYGLHGHRSQRGLCKKNSLEVPE
jgi:hypothetical protein